MGGEADSNNNNNNNNENKSLTDLISVEVLPLQRYVLNGVVTTKLPFIINVKCEKRPEDKEQPKTRPPFDLSLVLDRSGSMEGDKLNNSKKAIKNIIDNLTAEDKVSFVIYDDKVETVFQNADISQSESLKSQIDSVVTAGCTNLCGGMVAGIKLLKNRFIEDMRNLSLNPDSKTPATKLRKVFLFSDGLVNEGITNPTVISQKAEKAYTKYGISVNTFGVGNDFDENIMKGIATAGKGAFFYIKDAEEIQKQVSKGLRGLTSVVATNAFIKFRGLNGSLVESIHKEPKESLIKGVELKEIKEGDWKRVTLYADIRPPATTASNNNNNESTAEVLQWSLHFKPVQVTEAGTKLGDEVTLSGKINLTFTDDEKKVLSEENKDVKVSAALTIIEAGADDKKVVTLIDEGRMDEALHLKKQVAAKLAKAKESDKLAEVLYCKAQENIVSLEKKDRAKAKKEAHYAAHCEEDESDMGYALFD